MEIRKSGVDVRLILLIGVFIASYCTRGRAQSCLPCDESLCKTVTCSHGVVKDYCGCCDECLKGPGEKCGNIHGTCVNGSRCYIKLEFGVSYIRFIQTPGLCEELNPSPSLLPSPAPSMIPESLCIPPSPVTTTSTVSLPSSSPTPTSSSSSSLSPSPPPTIKCRPPCSIGLCKDGKNRYCSSNSTMSKPRNVVKERTPCQQTTCLACKFHVRPTCSSCPVPVNKRCLRHFYLCLTEHYQRNDIFLDMTDKRILDKNGDIVCDVPEIEADEDDGSGASL